MGGVSRVLRRLSREYEILARMGGCYSKVLRRLSHWDTIPSMDQLTHERSSPNLTLAGRSLELLPPLVND